MANTWLRRSAFGQTSKITAIIASLRAPARPRTRRNAVSRNHPGTASAQVLWPMRSAGGQDHFSTRHPGCSVIHF
jgi:hypothetical protein